MQMILFHHDLMEHLFQSLNMYPVIDRPLDGDGSMCQMAAWLSPRDQ